MEIIIVFKFVIFEWLGEKKKIKVNNSGITDYVRKTLNLEFKILPSFYSKVLAFWHLKIVNLYTFFFLKTRQLPRVHLNFKGIILL